MRTRHEFGLFGKTINNSFRSMFVGSVGQLLAPVVGLGSYAHAANPMAWACFTGAIVLSVPYILLDSIVSSKLRIAHAHNNQFDKFLFSALRLILEIGFYVGSAMLGAAMLGVATTPFAVCAAVGFGLIAGMLKLGAFALSSLDEADRAEAEHTSSDTPSFSF
jgi:hypothetical protein